MLVCIHLALVAYNGIFCGNLMLQLVLHEVEAGRMHGDEGGKLIGFQRDVALGVGPKVSFPLHRPAHSFSSSTSSRTRKSA